MHHGTLKRRRLDQILRHVSGRQVGTAGFGLEFGLDIDALQVKSVSCEVGNRRKQGQAAYLFRGGYAREASSCIAASGILQRQCGAPPADCVSWTHGRGWFPRVV